jgi:hypothetical protein
MQVPDIREGDQVQPGIPVADVLDISEMEVVARVGELDRANLREGQEVNMRLDALSNTTLTGKIKSLSGTASANAMSFDPAKKFDVVFSVDMRELLTALGAKPAQIEKILATAEQNRKKHGATSAAASSGFPGGGFPGMMSGGPGMGGFPGAGGGDGAPRMMTFGGPGGGIPGGMQAGGGFPGAGGGEGRRQFGGAGGAGMPPEIREAMNKVLKGRSMADLSPEERQKVMEEMRKALPAEMQAQMGRRGGGQRGEGGGQRGEGGGQRGGQGGPPELAGGPGMMFGMARPTQFTEKEMAEAKLPPPPEEDSQFDVLLRPGLLADVEIIVEKVPNALHLPMQAIFERDGKTVVFVQGKNQIFEPREVKPLKRSESVMILASGVTEGETVALADPTAAKQGQKKSKSGGGAMGALGGGKS